MTALSLCRRSRLFAPASRPCPELHRQLTDRTEGQGSSVSNEEPDWDGDRSYFCGVFGEHERCHERWCTCPHHGRR